MKRYRELAKSVTFRMKGSKVILNGKADELLLIGEGRSAFAFKICATNQVMKVFFSPFEKIAAEEAEIYKQLRGNHFFPIMHDYGSNYLVIDYVQGTTLFNCLVKGIPIEIGRAHV